MDISYWIQSNPKITVGHTTKKFYGKYLYKIVLYVPAGRLINSKGDIATELEYRQRYNHGGSWWHQRQNMYTKDADVQLLETLRKFKQTTKLPVKIRIEEPNVQIYAETNETLIEFTEAILASHKSIIESITGPEDDVAKEILNSGAIIRKNDLGYRYKVIFRDGTLDLETKRSLYEYLTNLGPELVHVPRGTLEMLTKHGAYIWNCYFYTNDEGINTMVRIICPSVISNCHELIVIPHK